MKRIDDLLALRVFERISSLGSLTEAARDLGLSLAVVSKRLAKLEQQLGCQLIHRNTRKLTISDEGRQLEKYARRIIAELEQAEEALSDTQLTLSGPLRITAPNSFGHRHLIALLARFHQLYPAVEIQLQLSDEVEDLITDDIDIAIRYGELPDSRLVARRLLDNKRILCASPAYLARHGMPETLQQLQNHRLIVFSRQQGREWRFDGETVDINHATICNDGEAAHIMALSGMGIVRKSYWDVAEDLATGTLQTVLADTVWWDAPIHVVYLRNPHQPGRISLFIEFLTENMRALHHSVEAP